MKKILLYSLLLLLPLAVVSCEKGNDDGLSVLIPEERVSTAGGKITVEVLCKDSWYVETRGEGEIEGLALSKLEGKGNTKLTVEVLEENYQVEEAIYTFFVVSGTEVVPVSIRQAPMPLVFSVTPASLLNVAPQGVETEFLVKCNTDEWGMEMLPDRYLEWCRFDYPFPWPDENDEAIFWFDIYDAGDITAPRSTTLRFYTMYDGEEHEVLVPVSQLAY